MTWPRLSEKNSNFEIQSLNKTLKFKGTTYRSSGMDSPIWSLKVWTDLEESVWIRNSQQFVHFPKFHIVHEKNVREIQI